jgi:hypothetical protein
MKNQEALYKSISFGDQYSMSKSKKIENNLYIFKLGFLPLGQF